MREAALLLGQLPSPRVWGGEAISRHLGVTTGEPIGELWLAYDDCPVLTGAHAGETVAEALRALGGAFLGPVPFARFGLELPLLAKFLDTSAWLSVQVHPDDAYAHTVERASGFHGKTEAWCILQGTGELIYGVSSSLDAETVRAAALDGSIDALLAHVIARPGDVIYVPAGTIHALGPGLLLYEVQQRSDLTYRLYDYGRPRELHLDRALEVSKLRPALPPELIEMRSDDLEVLLAAPAFLLARFAIAGSGEIRAPHESFLLLTLVEGSASWDGRDLRWGETLLIAAGESVRLAGDARFLGSFVPSPDRLARLDPRVRVP